MPFAWGSTGKWIACMAEYFFKESCAFAGQHFLHAHDSGASPDFVLKIAFEGGSHLVQRELAIVLIGRRSVGLVIAECRPARNCLPDSWLFMICSGAPGACIYQ